MTEKRTIPHFHLEAERQGGSVSLSLYDAEAVSAVSPEWILVKMKGGEISIRGERLSVAVLENRRLSVRGMIRTLEVLYDPA